MDGHIRCQKKGGYHAIKLSLCIILRNEYVIGTVYVHQFRDKARDTGEMVQP